ncbi:alkaline phosphatase D family protein [Sphingorhabdus arenilitoris]|uniref:Alkaline phosphatase D family protein n=1 Tax=Sphingorhabdus arenilitoris TaxID=1490041 RepID=A0ABV8RHT2_9SPHN
MRQKIVWVLALSMLSLSGCATYIGSTGSAAAPTVSKASAPQTALEALRPYYAGLNEALPVAPAGVSLPLDSVITRFAFGSCVNENRDMDFWNVIAAEKPQAFFLIGDNVYGDTETNHAATIPSLQASYRKLSSRQQFADFRKNVPMMATWDDHDYGANDAGGSFTFKEYAEKIFENYWGSADQVRSRPGVYESRIVGPEGKRVQFILLDTRFFRSDLARMRYQKERPPLGPYIPNVDPAATMLGDAQWQWLEAELARPADLRFIISSVQVITSAHGYESWYNFPKQREKLYALLAAKNVNNAVLLSGDRHAAAMYRENVPGLSRPLYEFTSSSLNFAFGDGDNGAREPDPARLGGFWASENFGQVDIDWTARTVTMTLKKSDGSRIEQQKIGTF